MSENDTPRDPLDRHDDGDDMRQRWGWKKIAAQRARGACSVAGAIWSRIGPEAWLLFAVGVVTLVIIAHTDRNIENLRTLEKARQEQDAQRIHELIDVVQQQLVMVQQQREIIADWRKFARVLVDDQMEKTARPVVVASPGSNFVTGTYLIRALDDKSLAGNPILVIELTSPADALSLPIPSYTAPAHGMKQPSTGVSDNRSGDLNRQMLASLQPHPVLVTAAPMPQPRPAQPDGSSDPNPVGILVKKLIIPIISSPVLVPILIIETLTAPEPRRDASKI